VLVGNLKATLKGKSRKSIRTVKALSVINTSNVENKERTTMEVKRPNPRADGALIGGK
jgi:hypothetical protein